MLLSVALFYKASVILIFLKFFFCFLYFDDDNLNDVLLSHCLNTWNFISLHSTSHFAAGIKLLITQMPLLLKAEYSFEFEIL